MTDAVTGKEIVLEDYVGLIYQHSQFCWRRLPVPKPHDMDDLVQEGKLLFFRIRDKYDPSRGCRFSTMFTISLRNHYSSLCDACYKGGMRIREDVYWTDPEAPVQGEPFNTNFLNRLNETARRLAVELLKIASDTPGFTCNRPDLRRKAYAAAGLDTAQAQEAMRQIRLSLSPALA